MGILVVNQIVDDLEVVEVLIPTVLTSQVVLYYRPQLITPTLCIAREARAHLVLVVLRRPRIVTSTRQRSAAT